MNADIIINNLKKVREQSPLIHNITNFVVMNNTANALLSLGASPVMAHAVEEMEDMVAIASGLVINIGTLSKDWVEAMFLAGEAAKHKGIPCVFDPVGAGASKYRTQICKEMIERCKPAIIRGNASEIMVLANLSEKTKGVDSTHSSDASVDAAKQLAKEHNCVVSVSGAIDYITDGTTIHEVANGSPLMPKITGMGCSATGITAAFAACNNNMLEAAVSAMAIMGITGEIAAEKSNGPGSLQVNFLDTLYYLSEQQIKEYLKIK